MNSRQALFVAFAATVLFASAPASIRTVSLDTFALGICRLALASLGMTAVLGWRWQQTKVSLRRWDLRTTRALLLVGIAFGIHWLLFFLSVKTGNAAVATIGMSTYGLHLILLGWLLGRGQITSIDVAGMLLACIGTWLVMPELSFGNDQTLGLLIGVLGGLTAAFLPLLHQHYGDIDSNLRAWGQFTFAILVFACCQPWSTWDFKASEIPLILYLGLGIAFVGHGMWVHSTTVLSTTTTSILSYLYLPTSLIIGFVTIGEKLSGPALIGTALVLFANTLVLINGHRRGTLKLPLQDGSDTKAD